MEYKRLQELRNLYPSDEETISDSFVSKNEVITYSGIYPENFIEFSIVSLDDIVLGSLSTDPNISFKFIIEFEENGELEKWTSKPFLDVLQTAIQENNPYFNKDTVVTARVNFDKLKNYWKSPKFEISEAYAEVKILDTIKTKEDIIKHINWIVSSDEDLRPVSDFGKWSLYTSRTVSDDTLGFPLSDKIDALSTGEEPGEFPDGLPSPDNYFPFGVPGNYRGESRSYGSRNYIWLNDTWEKQ